MMLSKAVASFVMFFCVTCFAENNIEFVKLHNLGLEKADLFRKVIESHKSNIYKHYFRSLKKHPDSKGRYTFELTMAPDGTVIDYVLVESELNNGDLEKDIESELMAIKFSPFSSQYVLARYTFIFFPVSKSEEIQ